MDNQTLIIALAIVAVVLILTQRDAKVEKEKCEHVIIEPVAISSTTPAEAVAAGPVVATPMSTASRFCDRSARSEDYAESQEDSTHTSGYSPFTVSANTVRHRAALS